MSPVCVSFDTSTPSFKESYFLLHSSIHQDVPLYSLDEFKRLAPEEARTEEVLSDEHQLMLNRLSFELAERQRFSISVYHSHFN